MPPVSRCHEGSLLVPTALLDAIESAFGVTYGCAEEYGLHACDALNLERICTVPYMGRTLIPMDATAFTHARNTLDIDTLNGGCDSKAGQDEWAVGVTCDFCMWCQALTLRDWCDEVLDRAGFTPPPYCDPTPPESDVAAAYDAIWAHVNDLYKKEAAQR